MRIWRLILAIGIFVGVILLVGPIITSLLSSSAPRAIEETHGDATIYFAVDKQRVLGYESCQQVEWRLEGIQAVKLNDLGVTGEGTREICGTSPVLEVIFQDGSAEYYWLPRDIVFTAQARAALLLATVLLVTIPFVLGVRVPPPLARAANTLKLEPRAHLIFIMAITLVGLGLRLLYVDTPMWIDEGRTFLKYGAQPLSFGLTQYDEPGNHVFHTFLVHIAYQVFGINENWVVRLPAFIAGVLVIPATYAVASTLYNRTAGLIAAALISASTVMIAYSVNARGYTLLCLFVLLSIILGRRLKTHPRGSGWIVFAVLGALGFYTLPTMLFPYTAIMLWLFIWIWFSEDGLRRKRSLIQLVVSGLLTTGLTFLLYLPIIQASGLESLVGNSYVTARPWSEFWADLLKLPRDLWGFAMREIPLPVQILIGAGIIVGLLPRRGESNRLGLLAVMTVVVTLLITLVQRVVGYDRVLLFLLPIFAAVAGVGLTRLISAVRQLSGRLNTVVGIVALVYTLWAGSLVILSGRLADSSFVEMEDLTTQIEAIIKPTDGIATIMRTHNFEYYLAQHEFPVSAVQYSTSDVQRLYLVVRDSETPDAVIVFNGMDPEDFDQPRLLQPNKHYSLYVADRIPDA